jgi:hypothetical protein
VKRAQSDPGRPKRVHLDQLVLRMPANRDRWRQALERELERTLGDPRLAQQAADAIAAQLKSAAPKSEITTTQPGGPKTS